MEARLPSFKDSKHGAEFVYKTAAMFGFDDYNLLQAQEAMINANPIAPAVDLGAQSAAWPGSVVSVSSSSDDDDDDGTPQGPVLPDDSQWQLAQRFVQIHGEKYRYNVDGKYWLEWSGSTWERSEGFLDIVGAMLAERGADIYRLGFGNAAATKRFYALQSAGAILSVARLLQPKLRASEADFDQHPFLLNTPDGVVDLRTGAISRHDPLLLMRKITLVGPNSDAIGKYEKFMPRFLAVLHNVTQGNPTMIAALRAWLAYCLTGGIRHQAFCFLHGPPGAGKSLIMQVFFEILHRYSFMLTEALVSKNGNEGSKRFGLADLVGIRMGFMDETQLGSTFDETWLSKGASAKTLVAEIKFGRSVTVRNTMKINIVGNHKPNLVAADTGGLPSRMLLYPCGGINYRLPGNNGKEDLLEQIMRDEAPYILMWALEQSIADYKNPGLFNQLTSMMFPK